MDVLVMLQELPEQSPVLAQALAQVHSTPSENAGEHPMRDVVTMYGVPNAESLALALAAALESSRAPVPEGSTHDVVRSVDVWPERGAVGDAAWVDEATGQTVKREVDIPLGVLLETAGALLADCGQAIRRLLAGLLMPGSEGTTHRAISFSFATAGAAPCGARLSGESLLASLREADGITLEGDEI